MLFDHQCDCLATVINAFLLERMLQIGNRNDTVTCLMVSTCPFYYVLLEQYYTGEMNFPEVNGVDEGTLIYFLLALYPAIYGVQEAWLYPTTTLFGLLAEPVSYGYGTMMVLRVVMPCFGLVAFYNIYEKNHLKHFKQLWDTKYMLAQLVFYPISMMTYHTAMVNSPTKIWETNNRLVQMGHGL